MKGTVNLIFFCAYILGIVMSVVSTALYENLTWWGHLIIILPLSYFTFLAGVNMAYGAIVRELTEAPRSDTI